MRARGGGGRRSESSATPDGDVNRTSPDSYAERLRALVDAGIFVSGELHLDAVLDRIVQTACHVIRARYGALGVIDEQGTGLSNFVFRGLSPFDKERIGSLPVGRGLLGALIRDPRPIRLADLSADERSVGFPPNHPTMTSFLGVPIRSRGRVFGNLYLTEKDDTQGFTEEDEHLAVVLADQAGVAIENARLFEDSKRNEAAATRRRHELELVQEVGTALIAELDPSRVLRLIVQRARELVDADTAMIGLYDPTAGELIVRVASGHRAGALEAMKIPVDGSFSGIVLSTLEPILVADAADDSRSYLPIADAAQGRAMIFAPLIEVSEGVGVLVVVRREADSFDDQDVFVVRRFADLASLALQNARAVAAERGRAQIELELAESRVREQMRTETLHAVIRAQEEERRRIARELHDSAGQALASILLGIKVAQDQGSLSDVHARLADLREVASSAVKEVRRISLELRPTALDDLGLEAALVRYADDVAGRTGVAVSADVSLEGGRLDPDVETVLYRVTQESVNNAIKYAEAKRIDVLLVESHGTARLTVSDDGRGFDVHGSEGLGLGIRGMRERAGLVGGTIDITSSPGKGTSVALEVKRGTDAD